MAGSRRITVEFLGRDTSLSKTADKVEGRMGGLGGKLKKFGGVAAGVLGLAGAGGAVVAFGKSVITSASNAQQSLGATETVFGKFSDKVVATSKKAANEFGLSANEYRENANLIGSLFKNQGVAADKLAGKTKDMIGTGADLAATFGGTTKEAVEALGSAFKGEYDPLERYGISLKDSTVKAELAKRGQDKLTGAALAQAKQLAITDLITKQSKDSIGAFAKESDTLAGAQQRLGAKFENLKATLGEKLLPVATAVVTWFSKLIDGMKSGEGAGGAFARIMEGVGNVLRPVGEFIGHDLVPFIKDLGKRFSEAMGGSAGFKKVMVDLEPAVRVLKAVLGVLWEGIKWAARTGLPVLVAWWKVLAKAIGFLGRAAIDMWNNFFQPAMKFMVKGIGWVMTGLGKLFSALGNVPGFGWAKDAGDKLQRAGTAAQRLADNIRDIPKEKKVTVTYVEKRRRLSVGVGSSNVVTPRAAGGPVTKGAPYIVGERRPEIFVPNQSGRIVPRVPAQAAGTTVNIHISGALDPIGVGKQIETILAKLQRQRGAPLQFATAR